MSQNWNLINKQTGPQDPELRQAQREMRADKGHVVFVLFRVVYIDSVHRQNLTGLKPIGIKPIEIKPIEIKPIRTKPIRT
jgi:hypothetical protein